MAIAYLHIGSNIGNRAIQLSDAQRHIVQRLGNLLAISHIYETEAWGVRNQANFYNQALAIETKLSPEEVLQKCKQIEEEMGRKKEVRWGKRLIDIDILFYGEVMLDLPNLKIPHADIANRNFVLIPMLEIAPDLVHPISGKTIEEIYWESEDTLEVVMLQQENI